MTPVEHVQPAASGEEAAIRTLTDRFLKAFNAGDIDAIMKNYIWDESLVVFDLVPRKQYLGADAYREAWGEMFSRFEGHAQMEIAHHAITVDGSVAFGHCFSHVTGTDKQGHPVDRWVRVTNGYRKIAGNWLIVLEHISMPVDLSTGKLVPITKPMPL